MKNEKMNSYAEKVVSMVWNFMKNIRNHVPYDLNVIFNSILMVLYAYHKNYDAPFSQIPHNPERLPKDDTIYSDLLKLLVLDNSAFHLVRHFRSFITDLESQIDRDKFNAIYLDVLKGLFDLLSPKLGRVESEFYTPSEITKLMAYIVNKEHCNSVFDPFCGTASIVYEISKIGDLPHFSGQELNFRTSLFSRVFTEALYGHDKCISNVDSIVNWSDLHYDAVISCPPMGLLISREQLLLAERITPNSPCRCLEDIILSRPFYCNNAQLTVTHLPLSFCFKRGRNYELRKELIENNLVDTIIELPKGILYSTGVSSIILICKRGRSSEDPIKFIQAKEYFLGNRAKRTFDYERFLEMIEGDRDDIVEISIAEIQQNDYNLESSLYNNVNFKLEENQKVVRLEELISSVAGERVSRESVNRLVEHKFLSADFIEVLLNKDKHTILSNFTNNLPYFEIKSSNDEFLLSFSSVNDGRYGIKTGTTGFLYPSNVNVYKINTDIVTPAYLVYLLINNQVLKNKNLYLSGYMKLPIVIDSLEKQKELINREIQIYNQKVEEERMADALRLGVKQNVSDLEHMLGTTQERIGKIFTRLEKVTPEVDSYQKLVKSLKDNVEYMNRIIKFNNANIDSRSFNLKEDNIVDFINDYVDAWRNYGGECFEISINNLLSNSVKLHIDKSLLTVMLDSILNNAKRHGFHKRKNYTDHNIVQINLSLVEYNTKPYLLLSVVNNGDAMADTFTINDYISKGRYSSITGRSGLGGYHVYQIVKGHNGFLYLDKNKVWNLIVDLLFPIDSQVQDNILIYENECI